MELISRGFQLNFRQISTVPSPWRFSWVPFSKSQLKRAATTQLSLPTNSTVTSFRHPEKSRLAKNCTHLSALKRHKGSPTSPGLRHPVGYQGSYLHSDVCGTVKSGVGSTHAPLNNFSVNESLKRNLSTDVQFHVGDVRFVFSRLETSARTYEYIKRNWRQRRLDIYSRSAATAYHEITPVNEISGFRNSVSSCLLWPPSLS